MEELKNNDNLVIDEKSSVQSENKESEIQEFTQVLMHLNEEYTKENAESEQKNDSEKECNGDDENLLLESKDNPQAEDEQNEILEEKQEEIQGEQQSFLISSNNAQDDNFFESSSESEEQKQIQEQLSFDETNPFKDETAENTLPEKVENQDSPLPILPAETEEEKQIREAFEKQAESNEENLVAKPEDPDAYCEVEYKQIKLQKLYNKIAYDLTDPTLTTEILKERILDASNYTFESYMLLTSKIKGLKKSVKDLRKVCAVIGLGESTALAKKWEIRQAKALKVSEIQVIMPLSIIKEGKKRLIEKEFLEYRKMIGEKIAFTVAIDANHLTNEEFSMALACALQAKPKKIFIKNAIKLSKSKLLFTVKSCAEKCKVQVDFIISKSEEIKRHAERGIDVFVVEKAIALAESIKHEEE